MNIANINALIQDYDATKKKYQQAKIDENIPSISGLLGEFGAMRKYYYKWNRINAERYNIFDILNIRFHETKTHTPFLVNLLNPRGSHGQGLTFFNLFINEIAPAKKVDLYQDLEPSHIRIREEKSTKDGRLDIFIECLGGERRFVIVIENKIHASDQYRQLARYYRYCKEIGYTDENILLLYLTKDRKDAADYSMTQDERKLLANNQVLVNISYREEIKKMLIAYIGMLKSEKVKIVTQQYLNIIKTF